MIKDKDKIWTILSQAERIVYVESGGLFGSGKIESLKFKEGKLYKGGLFRPITSVKYVYHVNPDMWAVVWKI